MSRAREASMVYVVADSVEQAVEDLGGSWSQSRRIGWAIDRGTPARGVEMAESSHGASRDVTASVRHARLVAEREAVAAVVPADPGTDYYTARNRVRHLEMELADLDRAERWNVWRGTPVGEAAIAWRNIQTERRACMEQARHVGWRERHGLVRRADRAAGREPLRDAFEQVAAPERARLQAELPEAQQLVADLEGQSRGRRHFEIEHPEALRRLDRLDNEIAIASWELDLERQGLDGVAPKPLSGPSHEWGITRDGPVLERGMDLGIGL